MRHDRYLIYQLLGRSVEIRVTARHGGQRVRGVVEKVCRDIFSKEVRVTVSGSIHSFREPEAIVPAEEGIHFLYGDVEPEPEEEVPHFNAYDESLHEHLERTAARPVSRTVFKVGAVQADPRQRWRSRVAV